MVGSPQSAIRLSFRSGSSASSPMADQAFASPGRSMLHPTVGLSVTEPNESTVPVMEEVDRSSSNGACYSCVPCLRPQCGTSNPGKHPVSSPIRQCNACSDTPVSVSLHPVLSRTAHSRQQPADRHCLLARVNQLCLCTNTMRHPIALSYTDNQPQPHFRRTVCLNFGNQRVYFSTIANPTRRVPAPRHHRASTAAEQLTIQLELTSTGCHFRVRAI